MTDDERREWERHNRLEQQWTFFIDCLPDLLPDVEKPEELPIKVIVQLLRDRHPQSSVGDALLSLAAVSGDEPRGTRSH